MESSSTSSSSSSSSESSSSSSSSESSIEDQKPRRKKTEKTIKPALKSNEVIERSKEMFKSIPNIPEKHIITMPDSPKKNEIIPSFQFGSRKRQERSNEFEMQCRKEVVKKPPRVLPKSKLGFIGRMPFVRKQNAQTEEAKKAEISEPTPPPPPVISSNPIKLDPLNAKAVKEKVLKMQMAFNQQQQMTWPDLVDMEMDMEISTPDLSPHQIPSLPPPPMIRPSFPTEMHLRKSGDPLPQDFQDALSIIFPNQRNQTRVIEEPQPVPPPPPDMSDIVQSLPPTLKEKEPNALSLDEMAMLGIDLEDMAAQRFS